VEDAASGVGHVARVAGGGPGGKTADGGFVQRVEGLGHLETYRLTGRVRSTWPVDLEHECRVGIDPTGQETDPEAGTIVWTTLPLAHGMFVPVGGDPVRPSTNALSIWLRARTTSVAGWRFEGDFDSLSLRRVKTGAGGG
jgi:hypothetical protein